MPFDTVAELKAANEEAGLFFFSKETMRFFNSRIETQRMIGGHYFVTSEQESNDKPRKYTVRVTDDNAGIHTHGDFMGYAHKDDAITAAREAAGIKRGRPPETPSVEKVVKGWKE